MNTDWLIVVRNLLLAVGLILPAAGFGNASKELSQTPVFLNEAVQDNALFVMDDSAQMDMEVMLDDAPYGRMDQAFINKWFGRLLQQSSLAFIRNLGGELVGDARYAYLFNVGPRVEVDVSGRDYDGRRLLNPERYHVAPPVSAFAFLRSSHYNSQYYDPSIDYRPWPTLDGRYQDATFGNPKLDPNYSLHFKESITTEGEANLDWSTDASKELSCLTAVTLDFLDLIPDPVYCTGNAYPPLAKLQISVFAFSGGPSGFIESTNQAFQNLQDRWGESITNDRQTSTELTNKGLGCFGEQATLNAGEFFENGSLDVRYQCIAYTPATYYVPVSKPAEHYQGAGLVSRVSCSDHEAGARRYANVYRKWALGETVNFEAADGERFDGALTPDGRCLRKVAINDRGETYYNGRSFAEEMQNFSNWFQYHRRRHQSVRAAMGRSAMDMSSLNVDLVTANQADAGSYSVSMKDSGDRGDGGGLSTFLERVYHSYDDVPDTNTSPLRTALSYVGEQYRRRDDGQPVTSECQKNFAVMYSDNFADDTGFSGPGDADGAAGAPFSDGYSDTLADVAYSLRASDLRPYDIDNEVPVDPGCDAADPPAFLDCNSAQHANTFGVTLGGEGTLFGQPMTGGGAPYESVADVFANPPEWPNVNASGSEGGAVQVDDFYHAMINGLGAIEDVRFPDRLTEEVNRAISSVPEHQGSFAPVTFNDSRVKADSTLYSASFDTRRWSGDLTAWRLNSSGGKLVQAQDGDYIRSALWRASEQMPAPSDREIITYNPGAGVSVAFRWDQLTNHQKKDLSAPGQGQDRLAYLRGDRSNEGNGLRQRAQDSVLGDIVNSGPVYVDRPRMAWPNEAPFGAAGARYADFKNEQQDRAPTVYVGANDGMLHAFDAENGRERWAYLPNIAYDEQTDNGLSYLTMPSYKHQYYVDLTPSVADVFINTGAGDQWHSLLLGGLRAGGRGLFALDVTNSAAIDEMRADDLALWEFQHEKLGYLTEPVNVMLTNWNGSMEWVAVFGNGYHPETPSTGVFMLKLEGGLDGTWTAGSDYRYIEVASGSDAKGMTSDIRLWDTDRGDALPGDRLYAGDLDGHLWVFEPSGGSWRSAYRDGSGNPDPLFTTSSGQPITAAPKVITNPHTTKAGTDENLLVLFGTGKYLSPDDPADDTTQSFYGVWDTGEASVLARDDLMQRTITEATVDGRTIRTLSDDTLTWSIGNNGSAGWYLDFVDGERVIQSASVRNETLLFNTTIPPSADDPCHQDATSFRMFVDTDGTNPDQAIFDLNGDGLVNDGDLGDGDSGIAGVYHGGGNLSGSRILGSVLFDNNAGGSSSGVPNSNRVAVPPPFAQGRQGWRELISR